MYNPKILFFIPVWQRLEVTRLCYEGLQRFRRYAKDMHGWETSVMIVSSEVEHIDLARRYGFNEEMIPNKPVGNKFNTGLQKALSYSDWDYLFQLNSDDLLANELSDLFAPLFATQCPFFGINKLYFYDLPTGRMKYYEYLDGCGIRVISRAVIESVGWSYLCSNKQNAVGRYIERKGDEQYIPVNKIKPDRHQRIGSEPSFIMWQPDINHGLDNNSMRRIYRWRQDVFPMRIPIQGKPYVVDIKSEVNIWAYDALKELPCEYELNDKQKQEELKRFPELLNVVSYVR